MPNQYSNHLIHEKSPYLLQHAHNPVDWYPWGEEAFRQAKDTGKPIFLSIGYATCHWCHVMEEECFENEELAQLMNNTFINIKVDREELPHVDHLYMQMAQGIMATPAGWPLNLILTPELRPFFASTYMPLSSRFGLFGMVELVSYIGQAWHNEEREHLVEQAEKLLEFFEQHAKESRNQAALNSEDLETAATVFFKLTDPIYGGLKGAPKFPLAYQMQFLLRYSQKKQDSRALYIVEKTLDHMCKGGIYDQIGGGFSRYSVDEKWEIPHFEKMLYDNAFLIDAYLEAWIKEGKDDYFPIVKDTIDYLFREMKGIDGGFYSAQDADSEGKEGFYYTWSVDEIKTLLGDFASTFNQFFHVTAEGNFHGRSVLYRTEDAKEFAKSAGLDSAAFFMSLQEAKQMLLRERQSREAPFKDDKILIGWNALLLHSLVKAAIIAQESQWLTASIQSESYLRGHLWKQGQLLRRFRDGDASIPAILDDYVALVRAELTLFEATGEASYLQFALQLCDVIEKQFKGPSAYYQTSKDEAHLLIREELLADGAEPSGNALHGENLIRLYQLSNNPIYLQSAEQILSCVIPEMEQYPLGYVYHLLNFLRYVDRGKKTVVIALNETRDDFEEIRTLLFQKCDPHDVIIWRKVGDEDIVELLPYVKTMNPVGNKTTLYMCMQGMCQAPVTGLDAMKKIFYS